MIRKSDKKIKVLIVDDVPLICRLLTDALSLDSEIEVVGSAPNGLIALDKMSKLKPDVITLDVEMPVLDGLGFLKQVMRAHPLPVIMVSSFTYDGGVKTIEALQNGAFDFVRKPRSNDENFLETLSLKLCAKVKTAFRSGYIDQIRARVKSRKAEDNLREIPDKLKAVVRNPGYVVAIGISTGGPQCLKQLFEIMPETSPPVLVVQHMPKEFTPVLAQKINEISPMKVKEARDGERIEGGVVYIAPGDFHMTVDSGISGPIINLAQGVPIKGHRPSAELLFESVAKIYGAHSIGVIMTGMGNDGAKSLKTMREVGGFTIAQDKDSSAVFGMPKAAIENDAVDEVLSLKNIFLRLRYLYKRSY